MQVLSKRLSHRNHRRFRYSPHFFRGWRYLFPRGRHVPRITWSYLTTAWHSISGLSLTQNWPMILSASMIPNPVSPKNQNLPTHPRYRSRACLRQLGCTLPRVHFSDPLTRVAKPTHMKRPRYLFRCVVTGYCYITATAPSSTTTTSTIPGHSPSTISMQRDGLTQEAVKQSGREFRG